VVANLPGNVTITARVNGVVGSAPLNVAWRSDRRLSLGELGGARAFLAMGDHVLFIPAIEGRIPASRVVWSSSNPAVASFDSPGSLVALAPGTTTVVARYVGLVDSVPVTVSREPSGFGYFWSAFATITLSDYYSGASWIAAPGKGYSTAVTVAATWAPPYSSIPDFGWFGPVSPARDAMMHIVSLDSHYFCTAYVQPDTGFLFATPGAPQVYCGVSPYVWNGASVRMGLLAFRPKEFTGTLALVRPGWKPVMSTGAVISETAPSKDARDYAIPSVPRDSLFWFVSPGAELVTNCAIAPADLVPVESAVRVRCNFLLPDQRDAVFYALGFGRDARHGSSPIGFVELNRGGVVTRKVLDGFEITTTGSSIESLVVTVSGDRMAAFDRLPAVLLTAIDASPAACSMAEPFRTTATQVTFTVWCPGSASGLMLGVMF